VAKNNFWIFLLIGVIVLVIIFNTGNFSNIFNKQETSSISETYYDSNGNKIDFKPYNEEEAIKQKITLMSIIHMFGIIQNNYQLEITSIPIEGYIEREGSSTYDKHSDQDVVSGRTSAGIYPAYRGYIAFNLAEAIIMPNNSLITDVILNHATYSYQPNGQTSMYINGFRDSDVDITPITNDENNELYQWINTYHRYLFNIQSLQEGWGFYNTNLGQDAVSEFSYALDRRRQGLSDNLFIIGLDQDVSCCDVKYVIHVNQAPTSYTPPSLTINYQTSTCVTESCSTQGKTCGNWSDTCSGVLNCGGIPSGYLCNSTGQLVQIPSVSYKINVVNNGNAPYKDIKLISTTPSNFFSSFPTNIFTLNPGQSNNWTSIPIDISSYHGQTFTINIQANNTYTNQINTFQASTTIA
jgi:hypothetical protein